MNEIETTSLDALPSNTGATNNNVVMTATEKSEPSNNMEMQENINNELINGIQQAAASGGTMLPSRDIPTDTQVMQSDETIKPNFVPESNNSDYITKHETTDEIVKQNQKKENISNHWDKIFNELNIPILIAVLYFIFQLPIIQGQFSSFLPSFYTQSGSIKLTGRLVQGFSFGLIIYVCSQLNSILNI